MKMSIWLFDMTCQCPLAKDSQLNKLGLLIYASRKIKFHGEPLDVIVKGVLWGDYGKMGACFGGFGEGLKKWGFALNWLSESRASSMTDYHNKSFLEGGNNRIRLKV